jgi:hypothetical protein
VLLPDPPLMPPTTRIMASPGSMCRQRVGTMTAWWRHLKGDLDTVHIRTRQKALAFAARSLSAAIRLEARQGRHTKLTCCSRSGVAIVFLRSTGSSIDSAGALNPVPHRDLTTLCSPQSTRPRRDERLADARVRRLVGIELVEEHLLPRAPPRAGRQIAGALGEQRGDQLLELPLTLQVWSARCRMDTIQRRAGLQNDGAIVATRLRARPRTHDGHSPSFDRC